MILAGIDVGTNTLRLLLAEFQGHSFIERRSERVITRLGQGLDRSGVLSAEAMERSLAALAGFAAIVEQYDGIMVDAVGTSALRKASNTWKFICEVERRTGLRLRVIDGGEEARLTLTGVRRALSGGGAQGGDDPLRSAVLADIGGGSTELIAVKDGRICSEKSLDLGAVYLFERHMRHDPPAAGEIDAVRREARRELEQWASGLEQETGTRASALSICAGTAGTITTLASMDQRLRTYDPGRINGYLLREGSVAELIDRLARTTVAGRRSLPGLEPGREDIILPGAVIAQEIMRVCRRDAMLVSDWGLREGIVLALYERSNAV